MPFAAGLGQMLSIRDRKLASEFNRGDSLEEILNRHLLTVEQTAERELVTSVLLLSSDGKRLYHGAGPNLPRVYREAVDGSEIGPSAGSCGTAAFLGKPIYVSDIATDALWADYRHLALPHGLRSCWSTPIRANDGSIVGTFAIYHREPVSPAEDEVAAIDLIAGHVAQAIVTARAGDKAMSRPGSSAEVPHLKLVSGSTELREIAGHPLERLLAKAAKLDSISRRLQEQTAAAPSTECRAALEDAARVSTELAGVMRKNIERIRKLSRYDVRR